MINKEQIIRWWTTLKNDPWIRFLQNLLRRLIVLGIIAIIIYQLIDIGWKEVLRSLPTQPMFYILFIVTYLSLPVAEVFIYRQVWPVKRWDAFKAFLTKRVYNDEVMGYSGEVYLFIWGRKRVNTGDKAVMKNVRDNNIISAVTSNFVAFALVGILTFTGQIQFMQMFEDENLVMLIIGTVITIILFVVLIQFRKHLFGLPLRKTLIVFSIYLSRFLIHHGVLIWQWAIVMPETPISVWFTFLAIIIVVNRIPFLPSKDLLFVWAGIELSRMLDMATASVAGMLLVSSTLAKVVNLVLFMLISYYSKDGKLKEMGNLSETMTLDPEDEKQGNA